MSDDLEGFNPDWAVAPSATVSDLMRERGWTVEQMAAAVTEENRPAAARLIREVLDRRPLLLEHAMVLYATTGASVDFWLNREKIYRDGLAAGLKDVTAAAPGPVPSPPAEPESDRP